MACEHDEVVNPLGAFGTGAQFSRRVARPIRAALLVVVTSSVVDHIVEPETNVHLSRMFRQSDNVSDLLEALSKVSIRVVVAMWLGVPTENSVMEAPERRRIADSQLAPRVSPLANIGHCLAEA